MAALGANGTRHQEAARVVAVTHGGIVPAAIATALHAPLTAFWRIDVPPLCRTRLQRRGRVWTLRCVEPMHGVG